MSNITTPDEAPPIEADTPAVEPTSQPDSPPITIDSESKKSEKVGDNLGKVEEGNGLRHEFALDPVVNRQPEGHTFRGELFLSLPELGSVREALQGSNFDIEEVKTPPASPRAELSFTAATARRRTRTSTTGPGKPGSAVDGVSERSMGANNGKRKRGESTASLPNYPSSTMRIDLKAEFEPPKPVSKKQLNASMAPTGGAGSPILMSGKAPGARIVMPKGAASRIGTDGAHFRAVLLGVLNTIEADQGFSGADSIPYWFSHPVLPRLVEGVSFSACQLPINLGNVRQMVEEGKYNTHLELERDLRRIVRFALRSYPKDSQPFKAAERLNKLCTELMFDASYRIENTEYLEAQYPTLEEPQESATSTSSAYRHHSTGGGHKGSKQPAAGGGGSGRARDKESVKDSYKKNRNSNVGSSKATESELTAQIEQLQDKISELTQFVSNLSETPRAAPAAAANKESSVKGGSTGGSRGPALPLTAEEKVKLEEDMNQLTPEDLCQVVDKKLRNLPGVVLDPATGMLQELDVDLMAPRDQRNLKRYVARLLNLRNQKVKENEERAREIVAQQRAFAQLQEAQRRRRANSSSSSSSSSGDSSSSDSSSDEESDRETELNRLFRKGTAVSAAAAAAQQQQGGMPR